MFAESAELTQKAALLKRGDLPLALGLLTRLPIPVDAGFARDRGAMAAWAYPLAGGVIALLAGALSWVCLMAGMPPAVAAGAALAAQVIATGAMHEDGLADTADGFWGGWDRARRLEIMKDSRIGTYGVVAIVLSLGLRWTALAALGAAMPVALIASAMLSRGAMIGVMRVLPNARKDGLSRSVGQPGVGTVFLGIGLAVLLASALAGPAAAALALAAGAAALASGAIARAKIGGQTGDVLGATQQLAEMTCLATATIFLAGA